MKKMFLCIVLWIPFLYSSSQKKRFTIIVEPQWSNLDKDYSKAEQFGGKWILAGNITFKKKCKDLVCMHTLRLHWNGPCLDHLSGSLYRKNSYKENFLPIEHNLVCDSLWNKDKQTLVFNFNEKENLGPTTIFCLVLTVPQHIEPLLLKGVFSLETDYLPFDHNENLSLAFNSSQP